MIPQVHIPCCPVSLARRRHWPTSVLLPWLPLLLVLLTVTSASHPTHAEESAIRLVGPPGPLQLRQSNETRTPQLPRPDAEPTLRIATKWRTTLEPPRREEDPVPRVPDSLRVSANEKHKLPTAVANPVAPAAPLKGAPALPAAVEEVPRPREVSPPLEQRLAAKCDLKRPLSSVYADISLPEEDLPTNVALLCATESVNLDPRLDFGWARFNFNWSATGLCHQPLYFEDVNAERYGYTLSRVFQPAISGARFFLTIPALPYKMVVERPCDCIYDLGCYRPGDCAPRRCNRLPWRIGAAAVEVGTIAGLILLIP